MITTMFIHFISIITSLAFNLTNTGFAAETSANATVLTITAFTIERYVAICHPFLSHTLSKLSRAIKYIIVIWVVAMSLAIPQAMAFGIVCEELSSGHVVDDHCICNIKRSVIPHAFEISTFVFFIAPMSLITVLYILIGLQLHRSTVKPSRGHSVRMRHRVYKPVVTYANSATQISMVNGIEGTQQSIAMQSDDEGRKNFAKTAQATKHVVKMLGSKKPILMTLPLVPKTMFAAAKDFATPTSVAGEKKPWVSCMKCKCKTKFLNGTDEDPFTTFVKAVISQLLASKSYKYAQNLHKAENKLKKV